MLRSVLVVLVAMTATIVSGGPAAAADTKSRQLGAADASFRQRIAAGMELANSETKTYIVQMTGEPAIAYRGGVAGFAKSAPEGNERYDARSSQAQMYAEHLRGRQDAALAKVGASGRQIYSFQHALNGVAVRLTGLEAAKLRKDKTVKAVWEDQRFSLETNNSPTFLGLNNPSKGLRKKLKLRGKGIIIGVMDSGAVQEHPSFDGAGYAPPPADWHGICQAGEAWDADDCNNKLIGARWFAAGFLAGEAMDPDDFLSPRDSDGHGTHTASTAGGREVTASLNGTPLAKISGMAPDAYLAIYKVCYEDADLDAPEGASCFFSDSAAATEAAIADGVDILSFSVGTAASFVDPQDIAFLLATDAGIFVSRSAGNDGPAPSSTAAGEPWVTTVAASTHSGTAFANALKVNTPASVAGSYAALEGAFTAPLVEVGPVTGDLAAANPIEACTALPAGSLTGKIALILRGNCNFDVKIPNAFNAGAIGAVVFSQAGNPKIVMGGVSGPATDIPAVMVDNEVGAALQAALTAGQTVNVTMSASVFVRERIEGNIMAGFSSRGPYLTEQNWIKPDVTAPGVRILAGMTPQPNDGSAGDFFQYLQGTSMSTPHVAGIAALLLEKNPSLSPAQVKSSLMTTARQNIVKEDGVTRADPYDFGSGHIVPNDAINPGLTYDAELFDYFAASCGTVTPIVDSASCDFLAGLGYSLDPADLNLPSIGVANVVGSKTVTRRVTNVSKQPATYTSSYTAPPGFKVKITPNQLHLKPGETKSFTVTLTNVRAPANEWRFGRLTWRHGGKHIVRSPIAARAQTFVAPEAFTGEGASGSGSFDVTFGYSGAYSAGTHGLVDPFHASIANVPDDPNNTVLDGGPGELLWFAPVLPSGAAYAQWSMFDAYTSGQGTDDFDLYLFYCEPEDGPCTQVDQSLNATSDETVGAAFPITDVDGDDTDGYIVVIHAFNTAGLAPSDAVFFDWSFPAPAGDEGNMTVTAPGAAVLGATEPVDVSWTGLTTGPGMKQLGAISHNDASGPIGLTTVTINNDPEDGFCAFFPENCAAP
jgi:subtilisin family serine protease